MLIFWIVAFLLTAIACMAVLLPVSRRQHPHEAAGSFDIEVYRDQLSEIDADEARGLIAGAEASEARAEIGRRILQAHGEEDSRQFEVGQSAKWIVTAAILSIPVLAIGIYSVTGSPHLPGQPLQARLDKNPAENSIEELIVRAEGHLAENPEDGRGWDVIAPIYVRVRRYEDGVNAYRNAIRIGGPNAQRQSGLGEALTALENGLVTSEARDAFALALELEPRNSKSRFFLAMVEAQAGRSRAAIAGWSELAEDSPAQSPWRMAAINAIDATRSRLDETGNTGQPGPDAEDVAAAENMSAEDRGAMIETMVANLAEKLKENPLDREGWQRLVRSYVVLGETEKARTALQNGKIALENVPGAAQSLAEFAAEIGIEALD